VGPAPAVSEVLRRVLAETSRLEDHADDLEPDVRRAVEEAASCMRAEPFGFEPVVRGLVEAVLRADFHLGTEVSPAWRETITEVARAIYEDPASRTRLERFWHDVAG
jgi:hypothetical protein